MIEKAVAIPTLVGSISSLLATSAMLGLHILYPPPRHYRHVLIVNLLIADALNSLNNTISGVLVVVNEPGNPFSPTNAKCLANAWIGQFSIQAVDFNIFLISTVVLCTVLRVEPITEPSSWAISLICASAWVPGLITSSIALGLRAFGDVSGNWCWIVSDRLALRYALTHAWRIAIIIATISIYSIIYVKLKATFGALRGSNMSRDMAPRRFARQRQSVRQCSTAVASSPADQSMLLSSIKANKADDNRDLMVVNHNDAVSIDVIARQEEVRLETEYLPMMPVAPKLRKVLLLNGYPIAYVLLWVPGLANRLVESIGSSPLWLQALQSSSQFVGLANALTYGFSERIWEQMRQR